MTRFVFQRFWQGLLSLLILSLIIFTLTRMSGSPVNMLLPSDATEEDRQAMTVRLGLDRPLPIQYLEFISQIVRGDFGESIKFSRPCIELYFERLPNSLKLVGLGFLFAVLIAIPLGVISGSNRNTWIDQAAKFVSVIGIAAPSFWVGLVLMSIFAVNLHLLPAAMMSGFPSYILPAFSLSFFVLAGMSRLLRSSIIETIDSEYVKLARIKGVSSTKILWWHCLRNALIPVLSFSGMYVGMLIGGTLVIEKVFAWPGAGRLAYEGITGRDYPLVQCVVLIHGSIIVVINFFTDILYSLVDPRIRYN